MSPLPHRLFLKQDPVCPVCRQPFVAWMVNSRLFGVDGREDDRHVLRYVWAQEIQTRVRPDHQEIWHCPHCAYTALYQDFQSGDTTACQRHRWTAWRQMPPARTLEVRPWLRVLRGDPPWTDAQYLLLLSLARMALLNVGESQRDWMELGRVHLRLAWLYRENPVLGGSTATGAIDPLRAELLETARELEASCLRVQEVWQRLKNLVEAHPHEVGATRWKAPMTSMEQKIHALCLSQRVLGQVVVRSGQRNGIMAGDGDQSPHLSEQDLVAALQEIWSDLPSNEAEATVAAADGFERGILEEDGERGAGAQVQLMMTCVRLLMRTGQIRRGFSTLAVLSRLGFSEKQDLSRRLRDLERQGAPSAEKKPLLRQLNQVMASLGQFSDLREQLCDLFFEEEGESLRLALSSEPERSGQLAKLQERSVPELLYRELEGKGWLQSG